ncbi:MAG: UDP-N-acetylmuramoyl-L-alanine--D-glutamate ligase, partial [Candidatus Eiseniibacteriota bacterium]
LLAGRGIAVTATDARPAPALDATETLEGLAAHGVTLALGTDGTGLLEGTDVVVASPGIPPTALLLAEADRRGIPVVAELELAFQASSAPWIAITGTNGKSTTTALTGALLEGAGRDAWVAGNIGTAACERAAQVPASGVIVAEVSSFQLERVVTFKPRVACVLNLTPDHLDRHGSIESYAALKARVFARQGATDRAVLNADDPATTDWDERFHFAATPSWFGARGPRTRDVAVGRVDGAIETEGGELVRVREGHREVLLPARALAIPGPHNVSNALAAVACTLPFGLAAGDVARGLRDFAGLEHRIEPAGTVTGVRFYNDSKATNVDSMRTALLAFDPPLVVIAGGRDKAGDWESLRALAEERIGRLILLGESSPVIERAWARVPSERARDLDDAVRRAHDGAVGLGRAPVVLSPGCASFDLFKDYEDRGRQFKARVAALAREVGP